MIGFENQVQTRVVAEKIKPFLSHPIVKRITPIEGIAMKENRFEKFKSAEIIRNSIFFWLPILSVIAIFAVVGLIQQEDFGLLTHDLGKFFEMIWELMLVVSIWLFIQEK